MDQLSKEIPEAFQHYLSVWNEVDISLIRGHLELSISADCIWTDPQNYHIGYEGLENNVKQFREKFPDAVLVISSNIDSQHQRYRYEWKIHSNEKLIVEGFDVATLNDEGLIERVDGFFGRLTSSAN